MVEIVPAPDNRAEHRSSLFVVATLYEGGSSLPVRVRNMSPHGALVEGPALPLPGSAVRLSRGSLTVSGTLVWLADSKAGVAFQSTISVADWLPKGKRATRQRLIDEVVHRSRVGATAAPSSMVGPQTTEFTLSEELERIGASLLRAAEELTSDAGITARHAAPLQAIDVAARALARIATDQLPCSRRASA